MKASGSDRFVGLMTSPVGRGGRVGLGLLIMGAGLLGIQGTIGAAMALLALVPISGGLFDFCLIAKALGYPLSGAAARAQLRTAESSQAGH